MEHTFMTIHNLTPDCNILFASDSIADILGWRPEDVHGRAVFDYFHPDEVQYARSIHSRGVLLDKAASLHYVRVLSAQGRWVSCECCFTVVHDVLVACVSIYRPSVRSERRALEGAQVRRIFSSSPRDPRYHMLEHLSPKFQMPPVEREPRAALILNRFTRNLTVMFATTAVASVLGLSSEQIKDKSFYRCIQERCLPEALKCLESAKANDSIAYLRFWSRDPRDEEDFAHEEEQMVDGDEDYDEDHGAATHQNGDSNNSDSDDGGAALGVPMDVDSRESSNSVIKQEENDDDAMGLLPLESGDSSGHYSSNGGSGSYFNPPAQETPLQRQRRPITAPSHRGASQEVRLGQQRRNARQPLPSVEVEAVVSCTSDGLVVILRRARPPIPNAHAPLAMPAWESENGLFAAPWAQQPVQPYVPPEMLYTFQAPLLPQYMPLRDSVQAAGGPPIDHLMQSIREVAVFAWALVGINGNFASHARGRPRGEATPPDGLPIWDPKATDSGYQPPENQAAARWAAMDQQNLNGNGNGKGKAAETLRLGHERPSSHYAHSTYAGGQPHQHGFGDHQSDFPSYTTQRQDFHHQRNDDNYYHHASMPQPYHQHSVFSFSADQASTPVPWRHDQGAADSGEAPGTSAVPASQSSHRASSPRFDGRRGGFP